MKNKNGTTLNEHHGVSGRSPEPVHEAEALAECILA